MMFKNLTFDGISLKEYGVYISGEAVFDSPTREVEMITIPGRNGSFALDKGRFNNITVTYPAGIYATSETEFAEKVSTLRNLLASRKGYCRLTDEYNPDEFRLGVYKAGLELDPTHYNEAGRFELSFDCKPQRFLFSGEEVFTLGEWGQTETKSGSIVSFEGDETTAIKSLTAQIVPKQSGSGDPSPSNVRPISGWSSVDIYVRGFNFLQPRTSSATTSGLTGTPNADGTITMSGTSSGAGGPKITENVFLRAGRYYVKGAFSNGEYYPRLDLAGGSIKLYPADGGVVNITQEGEYYLRIVANASGINMSGVTFTPILYKTEEATDEVVPYDSNSQLITTSLGQTVYGGTLEVTSGKLTIDKVSITFDGSSDESWERWTSGSAGSYAMFINIADARTSATEITFNSNYLTPILGTATWGNYDYFISANGIQSIKTGFRSITTVADWRTHLASNPLQVCYELATPTEITLTPTQVTTLLGNNNIWADSGDVTVEIGQNPYILVNPTLFEACPLIEFNSSGEDGEINLGSRQIKVLSAILGRVNLGLDVSGSKTTTRTWQDVITVQNAGSFNAGDILRFNGGKVIFTFNFTPINVEVVSQETDLKASWQRGSNNLELSLNNLEFPAGTDTTYSFTIDIKVKASETPSIEGTETFTVTTSYNRNGVLTITWAGGNYSFGEYTYIQGASNYTGYGDSTKNSLEDVDIYVDLDIGEAYSVDSSDNVVSLNNFVNLGGELPTLDPGATEITTDSSISNVKVTPRWWKV